MNEPEMELIRLHKRGRHQTFVPSSTPIPPEFLDSRRKTIMEFKNGKKEVKEDDWKGRFESKNSFHSPEAWRGRTIFKILPGGIENRTSVKVRSTASGPKRRGRPDDELIKANKGASEKVNWKLSFWRGTNKKEVQERSYLQACRRRPC